ncbi:glycosyltransferase family 2 protein [Candidatus Nitrosocosmicus arcticus]|uniref:Glycosyl transferase family 2 n=1 Tax=Candidatus Nitrosocosmicus arcticus TaxID=2035267 RepID=A0A557SYL8_9ARCH|nr:glycosyltransferase family 2 protein [Candidatus Nitrosocosmicus arcticus]TVP41700.1 Glycosyl transferase family 2 [Candidatus Nitrosocosmicus arcticus]
MAINQSPETNQSKRILIAIPAFNEEENIAEIILKAKAFSPEVLVYDDGSADKTAEVAEKNGALVIRNARNRGYGRALNTLFQNAILMKVDIVITLDSDGQHDPDQIPRLLQPLLENKADIVIGSRFLTSADKTNVPRYRTFGIKTITRFTQAGCYDKITDATSGFRAYSANSLSKLHLVENGMSISTEILLKANDSNLRIVEVPITTKRYDINDKSTHNPLKLGWSVISHVIQSLSFRHPLLFYGVPGLILLCFSSFYLYNALDLFSSTRYVSTNMIIISIGFSLLGIILLATAAIVHTIISLFKGKLRNYE